MEKTRLTAMTVIELKALAKEKGVFLPAGARKANIIAALMAVPADKKSAPKQIDAPAEPAVRNGVKSVKASVRKKAAPIRKASAEKLPKPVSPVREWKTPPRTPEPLVSQERVSESKFYTGPSLDQPAGAQGDLPRGYGEEKVVLMTRDPYVAYAYWEVAPARIERERAWFGWDARLCIRIYDVTGVQFDGRNAIGYYDQEISEQIGGWYFDFGRPSHSFCADVGLISPEGKFLTLIRSNYITMPRDGVSSVADDEWMLLDEEFMKLYGIPSGLSSPQIQEMVKRRLMQEVSSPGLFARSRAKRK
jgi:uncharacterized protein